MTPTWNIGNNILVKNVFLAATASTNNQTVIAAVSGKSFLVLSMVAHSVGVAGRILFNTPLNLKSYAIPSATGVQPNVIDPYSPTGIMIVPVGAALLVDNLVADQVNISISYIEFTP
jgi:hypothetical protein